MKAYIYHIVNLDTNKHYIGQTNNIEQRLTEHFRLLRKGEHHSHKLQRSYNKHGEEKFKVEYRIVQVEDEIELNILEMKEIDAYNSYSDGYNETRGGEGGRLCFSYQESVILYHILQRYEGINRLLGRHYKCESSVFAAIKNNHNIFGVEPCDEMAIAQKIEELQLPSENLIENYVQHNANKLNKETCMELLSVITQCEGYDKTMCEILNISSKLTWRLKQGLIYKDCIEEYEKLSEVEKTKLKDDTLAKYNVLQINAKRKRAGTKNQLTQEQVNYILDHQTEMKTKIAAHLGISADRVRGVIKGTYYKDLIANYYSSQQ